MQPNITFSSTTNMLLMREGKILLLKRSDAKTFSGRYMLPGGKQHENETLEEAAIRETFEETGLKVSDASLRVVSTNYHEYKARVYLVHIFTSSKFAGSLTGSREGTLEWVGTKDALANPMLYPDLKRHIQFILDPKSPNLAFTYHKFNEALEITESR